jgi:hypothetical protein
MVAGMVNFEPFTNHGLILKIAAWHGFMVIVFHFIGEEKNRLFYDLSQSTDAFM